MAAGELGEEGAMDIVRFLVKIPLGYDNTLSGRLRPIAKCIGRGYNQGRNERNFFDIHEGENVQ